jgi:hypothetical protein
VAVKIIKLVLYSINLSLKIFLNPNPFYGENTYFMLKKCLFLAILPFAFISCQKDDATSSGKNLQFKIKFDATQARLNNFGQPAAVQAGRGSQTPDFKKMSVHYLELAPNALTELGTGAVVYKGAETTLGGDNAVDFDKAAVVSADEIFAKIKLSDIKPGTYEWIRASVTYQNYSVKYNLRNIPLIGNLDQQLLEASIFVGFNTFIKNVIPRALTLPVNSDKKQGFWVVETNFSAPYQTYNQLYSGQAPVGSTTVVNPIFASSPIPAGSCVVTGKLTQPLIITGNESADRTITLSFSINNSFEWEDTNANGQLDFYADGTTPSEKPVDMGLRGLIPIWE